MKPNEIIELAKSEVGYIGKKSRDSNLYDKTSDPIGNFTKYARDLANSGYYNFDKSGYDWCCVFTDWLFWKASGENKEEAIKIKPYQILNAGIRWSKGSFENAGRIGSVPKPGACIFFLDKSKELAHTGVVVECGDTSITTVEGNVGRKVVQKSYKLNDPLIDSYGYPFYEEEEPTPGPEPDENWITLAEWKDINGKSLRLQQSK